MESFWKQVKEELKKHLPDHCYRMWIAPLGFLSEDSRTIRLSCPNDFFRRRVQDNYVTEMQKVFAAFGKPELAVELSIVSVRKKHPIVAVPVPDSHPLPQPRLPVQMTLPGLPAYHSCGRMLKKDYTFDHFVVGRNNDFAYSASLSLAQGRQNGNGALYLLADTGLGKSHLSQAVGHHVMDHVPTERVYYVTAEDFTNEMVASLKNRTIESFKEKYRRNCDVLILEDIHFLSGKDATQLELAMTLDYLLDANKKIIFSGCYLPTEIPKMNVQLTSRLVQGLVTRIESPDYDTRVKILRKKAELNRYAVPFEIIDYLAQELCDNVRQLESGLTGVAVKSSLLGEAVDINLARSVVATIATTRKSITVDLIKKLVCREFSLTESELVSASRKKRIVKPRQMAIFLARKYTDQPLKQISRSFNRYHATAIYSINAVEKELRLKGPLFEQVKYLSRKIESGSC